MLRLFDNSQLSCHRDCPRRYYFRHVRNWTSDAHNLKAGFGVAWHSGMDVLWQSASSIDTVADAERLTSEAAQASAAKWQELELTEDHRVYNLNTLCEMLFDYTLKRLPQIRRDMEIIQVEQPFIIPLWPDKPIFYCGRRDKVVRWNRGVDKGIWVVDHKTTGWARGVGDKKDFRAEFTESFSPNSQLDGYAFSAWMEFGEEFKGILVDATLVDLNVRKFSFIPVERTPGALDEWLWSARREALKVIQEEQELKLAEDELTSNIFNLNFLPVFPKNTGACNQFGGCQFLDLCKTWDNPHTKAVPSHLGFVEEEWSPFTPEQKSKIEELTRAKVL